MEQNKITDIADTIIDSLGETINHHVFEEFGHDLEWAECERLHNLVYDELIKELS